MTGYLLGIDAGNTMVKAVLFDTEGTQVAVRSCPCRTEQPRPGHVERDIGELTASLTTAIRDCLARSGVDPAQILGIGAAGHGNGLYVLDRAGAPLKGIQSIDTRAAALVEEMGPARARAHALSLQKTWAAQTPVLLAWAQRHDPGLIAQAGHFLLCKDVIVHHLTGVISTDISDAAVAGLIRFPERRYDDELLGLYGIAGLRDRLPPVHETCEVVGHVTPEAAARTGLAAGTPVVAGMIDIVASAVGSGVSRTGEASIVAGTWSINQVVVDRPKLDALVFMTSVLERDRYMVVEASPTSAANLEWFIREFAGMGEGGSAGAAAACSAAVAGVTPSADLPYYHPYLYGSSFDDHAQGGFYRLAGWHTRAELLYALFEGVVFGHRRHLDVLRAAGAEVSSAVLSGGAVRSDIWPQMFADILGMPITTSDCPETGALGACIAAAVGVGLAGGITEAAGAMTAPARAFTPSATHAELLEARYRSFLGLASAMMPVWAGEQPRPVAAAS
ncbi:FGGY-family carbohydrate kinase [Oceanicella sp. SM1341]|uniref:FGGY-family carbohydrate kinase n=1 Tax=Oceanicella sp. SM1341 TaxID=1548889 RepID=UPI000E544AE7|nr:FGGY-family carbohydrate kinase [Oceanicella sp. SM1341]